LKSILIINGPNLNLLGKREPLLYGSESFGEFLNGLKQDFPDLQIQYLQTNEESDMVNAIQGAQGDGAEGIILNPAALSHTAIAVADAVAAVSIPVVEVHISNIFGRETFRHHSFVSRYAKGVVVGFGLDGYRLALHHLLRS
jgi:3-dehydroquinate dehydratase-2